MSLEFDLAVIGAGPGGYTAAIRASQLGLKTAIIDKRETLGGTCLNVGCIPTKALLDSSEKFYKVNEKLSVHGIEVPSVKLDFKKLMDRKNKIVSEVCQGVDFLMKKNKITRYHAAASLKNSQEVELEILSGENKNKKITLNAKNILLATGSVPVDIPSLSVDGKHIITSDHAVNLSKIPKNMIIVGAGVIGLELGSVYSRLGTKITVIELMPRLLPFVDKQIAAFMQRSLESQGFKFFFEEKVTSSEIKQNAVVLKTTDNSGKVKEFETEVVLTAIGRKPYTENLGLENAGIKLTPAGKISIDKKTYQTNIKGIYAVGDAVEGPMLAHKAEEEGIAAAEIIAQKPGHVNYEAIPSVVYTSPELAWVGLSEENCKENNIEVNTGTFFFRANARAKAMNEADGLVKVIAHKKTDRLLGVFIAGPHASELIAEAVVAFEFAASSEDIARSVHAHPTLSEALREAAMAVSKWSIHS
ncbi:MAG: dihydrolipoyl dehydrogenase [Spirochaetia bacterium]|nr:dihydrolipoyl dehydrogenase [Spirochaetia bacterium]